MKLLRLTNSDDLMEGRPVSETAAGMAAGIFEQATGEPVELVMRTIWPAPHLPGLIESWIERYQPDMVDFGVNGYWYIYRSVPLQLRRKLGVFGRPIAAAGDRAGRTPWVVRTPPYHWTRAFLLRTVGGAHYFTPDEVMETVESCLRVILRDERIVPIVRGSLWHWDSDLAMEDHVHRRLQRLCANLKVHYMATDPYESREHFPADLEESDGLHTSLAGRKWVAGHTAAGWLAAWKER